MSGGNNASNPNAENDSEGPSIAAEPIPQWEPALKTWQWAWELHWIGFGALFMLLALYALLSLAEIAGKKTRTKRLKLAMAITSLLLIFGLTRALFFVINPYETEQCNLLPNCPVVLTRILFGIGLPCITASFSLVHLAFFQVTKLKLYPDKLQSSMFLFCIIAFHFILALTGEVLVSLYAGWKAFAIVCQAFFIIFNFTLSVSFIYSGTRIVRHIRRNHSSISSLGNVSIRSHASKDSSSSARLLRPNVTKLVKITYITVFLGFASCALQLYSIFALYGMYSGKDRRPPKPWPWFIFQSLYRTVELIFGYILTYVSPRQAFNRSLWCSKRSRKTELQYSPSTSLEKDVTRNPMNIKR